jgi:hypothetical protein
VSQRESGYERKERDLYETPAWVKEALLRGLCYATPRIMDGGSLGSREKNVGLSH